MSDIRRIYSLFVMLVVLGAIVSGVVGFLKSSFDFGIDMMESQVFDLQVKIRNLSSGKLTEGLQGWSVEKQKGIVEKLSPPVVLHAFGADYLLSFLSSSSGPSLASSSVTEQKFPDISLVGVSARKDMVSVTVNADGALQIWIFRKADGRWQTKDVPGYTVEDMEITKDRISFVLSRSGEKKEYSFAIAAVPEQYAAH